MIRRWLHLLGIHEWRYHGRMYDRRACIYCGERQCLFVNEWGVRTWL